MGIGRGKYIRTEEMKDEMKQTNSSLFKKGHIPHNKGKTKDNYEPSKRTSEKMKGDNNPSHKLRKDKTYEEIYGKEKAKEIIKKFKKSSCGKKFPKKLYPNRGWRNKIKPKEIFKKQSFTLKQTYKNNPNIFGFKKGEKHPNFNNWASREHYGKDFSPKLKEKIRKRDQYRCQQCFRHEDELRTETNKKYKLNIHHIDYNKKNNNPENLISLCRSCHGQTGFNRIDWTKYFQDKVK